MKQNPDLLFERAKGGSEDAWKEFIRVLKPAVEQTIRLFVRDNQDVEILTQETFFLVFRKSVTFEAKSSTKTWICGIAAHLARNHQRKNARWRKLLVDQVHEWPDQEPSEEPEYTADPESVVLETEIFEMRRSAFSRLPGESKQLLLEIAFEQKSYAEVSARMGIRVGALKTRVYRARKELNDLYVQEAQVPLNHPVRDVWMELSAGCIADPPCGRDRHECHVLMCVWAYAITQRTRDPVHISRLCFGNDIYAWAAGTRKPSSRELRSFYDTHGNAIYRFVMNTDDLRSREGE